MNITKIALFVLSISVLLCVASCQSEGPLDALKGYNVDRNYAQHPLDKAILDDLQNFIRSQKIPPSEIIETRYGENKNGQHAVFIYQEFSKYKGMEGESYILFYDKNNVRIKVKSWREYTSS